MKTNSGSTEDNNVGLSALFCWGWPPRGLRRKFQRSTISLGGEIVIGIIIVIAVIFRLRQTNCRLQHQRTDGISQKPTTATYFCLVPIKLQATTPSWLAWRETWPNRDPFFSFSLNTGFQVLLLSSSSSVLILGRARIPLVSISVFMREVETLLPLYLWKKSSRIFFHALAFCLAESGADFGIRFRFSSVSSWSK